MDRLQVIYEDNHLIGVNKPAGMLVQADATEDETLADHIKYYLKQRYEKPGEVFLGTIHRLDRPVSGAVVFARTSKALTRMNKLFQQREVEKTYWAVTRERPNPISGRLRHYLSKDREKNMAHAFEELSNRARAANAKLAELHYELAAEIEGKVLLRVQPITGRPHQIRVQLAKIGCPIWGDVKYGFPQANRDGNIHLHCLSLRFIHPVKQEPTFINAELPDEAIWNLFAHLAQPETP
jgi:23S rRNA pseudouridine1911/1915/1917 synthase